MWNKFSIGTPRISSIWGFSPQQHSQEYFDYFSGCALDWMHQYFSYGVEQCDGSFIRFNAMNGQPLSTKVNRMFDSLYQNKRLARLGITVEDHVVIILSEGNGYRNFDTAIIATSHIDYWGQISSQRDRDKTTINRAKGFR